jgi:hypothetical protein
MKKSHLYAIAVLSLVAYIPLYDSLAKQTFRPKAHAVPALQEVFPNIIEEIDSAPNLSPDATISDLIANTDPQLPL